ncbi:unnamed protein product [Cochlearia groenlandica]
MAIDDSSVTLKSYILVALVLFLRFPAVAAVPSEELESAISVLRVRGRDLFANAITISDILFDLLSAESLTLLAPTDSMLYNLDISYSLSLYVSTLRLHALPLRLPISELRSLPNGSSIPTFLPSHSLLLTKLSSSDSVYLDGVRILLPGLFYGQNIAVHGLANVLPLRSLYPDLEERAVALPPVVDSPEMSPSPSSTWWMSPSPEGYIEFFGRAPAEPPQIAEVSLSPADQLEEDLIVGDGDSWTTEF